MAKRIIMLSGGGASSVCLYNGIKDTFEIDTVIIEGGTPLKTFLKRRVSRLGIWEVFGQLLFSGICIPFLRRTSGRRVAAIKQEYGLDETPIPADRLLHVPSVNSDLCLRALAKLQPDVIIVNGTRIISKRILNSTKAVFINTHVGITPYYRGVHGAYWALSQNDRDHCGVTVHLVDAGIDTGNVLYQSVIDPKPSDNFITYTYIQLGEGIALMRKALRDAVGGVLNPMEHNQAEGRIWYHPTIWHYLIKRITKGVK